VRTRRTTRRIGLMACAIALAVGVATASGSGPSIPRGVTIEGDSLTQGSYMYFRDYLHGYPILSDSYQTGRHVAGALDLLEHQPLGRVVVFALGSNDYGDPDLHLLVSEFRKVITLAGAHRCVVFATVYANHEVRTRLNAKLVNLARQYGPHRVQIQQWARVVQKGGVELSPDGIHPLTVAGNMKRARLIDQTALKCLHEIVKPHPPKHS
jgi:hypothetical protein